MTTFTEKYGNVELRALSWKQPFATLMLHGKIETRVWDSKYRGWVLICASKAPYSAKDLEIIAGEDQVKRIIDLGLTYVTGHAIAIGRLVGSREMTPHDQDACFVNYVSPWLNINEKTGAYKEKCLWCHIYEDVQPIEAIALHGVQGWSTVPDNLKSNIKIL